MSEMTPAKATALRKPFPPESVGKLPKGGVDLDFVGHAAVTDRLLTVDPLWSWEPMALDQYGSPQCDREGNLWIKLTICGVTRLGVGDGKSMKERIGDAIRNGAMRFGVALDLWAKENLVEFAQAAGVAPADPKPVERKAERVKTTPDDDPFYDTPPRPTGSRAASAKQVGMINALMTELGITARDKALLYVNDVIAPRVIASRNELTTAEASRVIEALEHDKEAPFPKEQPA